MSETKKNRIYLKMEGACGNQFFQYAFARMIQEKNGGELILDYRNVKKNKTLWQGSDNLLKDFNTVPYTYVDHSTNPKLFWYYCILVIKRIFGLKDFKKKTYRFYLWLAEHVEKMGVYFFESAYYPFRFYPNKNVIIRGYYESPKYFSEIDDKICKELTPKYPLLEQNVELYDIITRKNSVCISIKRQDVENPDISDVYQYDINYFYHAADYIRKRVENPVWIIFSDNVEWCRENFHLEGEVHYETSNNPIWEKIRLMSGCKHFIIHNSTFSWWVQHLSTNKDKLVIAPVKWMLRDDQPIDIYEDHWVYMTNDGQARDYHD